MRTSRYSEAKGMFGVAIGGRKGAYATPRRKLTLGAKFITAGKLAQSQARASPLWGGSIEVITRASGRLGIGVRRTAALFAYRVRRGVSNTKGRE